jgi:hypothetical protein
MMSDVLEWHMLWAAALRSTLLSLAILLAGCNTLHGTPVRYQAAADIVKKIDLSTDDLADLQASTSKDERNRLQNKAIAVIDQWFHQFVRDLNASRADSSAGAAGATLGAATAATFVESVKAKTNYALFGAAVVGAFGIVDRSYFYEKTVPALVAGMGAARARLLLRMKSGQRQGVEDYDGTTALADLEDYYSAGTILAAISEITTSADADKKESLDQIRQLDSPTDTEVTRRKAITTAIWAINDASLDKAKGVAKSLGLKEPMTAKEARSVLLTEHRNATPPRRDALEKALRAAGLLK